MSTQNKASDLSSLDWEKMMQELINCNKNDGNYYVIVINKGQPTENRTRFLTYSEALELISVNCQKKRFNLPVTL